MGILDNLKEFFSSSKNAQPAQTENEYEKTIICEQIENLAQKIRKINSFDRSVSSIGSIYELKRRSYDELKTLHSNLQYRLAELDKQSKRPDPAQEALYASLYTGAPTKNITKADVERAQRFRD